MNAIEFVQNVHHFAAETREKNLKENWINNVILTILFILVGYRRYFLDSLMDVHLYRDESSDAFSCEERTFYTLTEKHYQTFQSQ